MWGTSYIGSFIGLGPAVKLLDLVAYQIYSKFRFSFLILLTN